MQLNLYKEVNAASWNKQSCSGGSNTSSKRNTLETKRVRSPIKLDIPIQIALRELWRPHVSRDGITNYFIKVPMFQAFTSVYFISFLGIVTFIKPAEKRASYLQFFLFIFLSFQHIWAQNKLLVKFRHSNIQRYIQIYRQRKQYRIYILVSKFSMKLKL